MRINIISSLEILDLITDQCYIIVTILSSKCRQHIIEKIYASKSCSPHNFWRTIDTNNVILKLQFPNQLQIIIRDNGASNSFFAGKPLPSIRWEKNGSDLEESNLVTVVNSTNESIVHIRDATRKDTGQYTINLKNPAGTRALTVSLKVLDRPGPPATVTVTDVTASQAKIHWSAPKDDGGSYVTSYVIEKRETSRLAWTMVASDVRLQL